MPKKRAVSHCAAFVEFAIGVPAFSWQSGEFTGVITDTGVGDVTLNMNAYDGFDVAECAVVLTAHNPANWPLRVGFSVIHTSDVAKQILINEEGAGGVASAPADVCFDIWVVKEAIA